MVSPPAVHPLCSTWLEANHAGSPPHLPAANGLGCSEDYPAGGLCSWKVKVRRGGEGRGCWGGVFSISHTYARAHTHTHTHTNTSRGAVDGHSKYSSGPAQGSVPLLDKPVAHTARCSSSRAKHPC